jgi:hypothetical protein
VRAFALAAAATIAACAVPRTRAASQPTRAAFQPAASDPRAVALVDAMHVALGGYDRWDRLQELSFELRYDAAGDLAAWERIRWDRWNGRLDFAFADPKMLAKRAEIPPVWLDVKSDLYNKSKMPWGTVDDRALNDFDAQTYAKVGREQLERVGYALTMIWKLRDPGAKLHDAGRTPLFDGALDLCKPACESVEVTFDPAVGRDTWRVDINILTHRPELIEKDIPGGRLGYRIDRWTEAGGLEWPSKLVNIGADSEVFDFSAIAVSAPVDATYEKLVDRQADRGNHSCARYQECSDTLR